jgi:gluconate kinase
MSIGNEKPYAILVFGAPMSGKTTFAKHFSDSINAPFFNFSELQSKHHMSRKLALEIIRNVTKGKAPFIIEGLMDTESDRDEIRNLLTEQGYNPALVWVQTDLNAIKQRMLHAYKTLAEAKAALASSYEHIEAPSESEKVLVISGKHTYQTQCKNVINNLDSFRN